METAPLKNFATWARTALIREVTARIAAVLAPGASERVEHAKAVAALEKAVAASGGGDKGRASEADKVAYTWFNRIIALRFMDANGYTGIGVVSPQAGVEVGQPEILAEAKRGVIDAEIVSDATSKAVAGLLDGTRSSGDPQGEAYALLLEAYCNYLHKAMPFMFEREGDFTELLIPANLLADDSVLNRSAKVLTPDVCKDVEVIGWLYQFYISERKDEVFAGFKKNKKAGADEIPAATQLFTPHWIVRYLVENSLGRLWMLNRPSSGLVNQMDYYIAPVDEETDFLKITRPEELKVIDPACGSGHMLTYAFDLLYAIYEEEGYAPADIPGVILANNLYGTEIDPRAGSLAAFALTMKARARQRTFFNRQVEPKVCVIDPISFGPDELDFLVTREGDRHEEIAFWNQFEHADTFGSLIQPDPEVTARLGRHLAQLDDGGDLLRADVIGRAERVVDQAEYLAPRYSVVVANPPYMGSKNMSARLADWTKKQWPESKSDIFAAFIERSLSLAIAKGLVGMITMQSWMFLSSFRNLRQSLLARSVLTNMAHLGTNAFETIVGDVVSTTAFTFERRTPGSSLGTYVRLVSYPSEAAKESELRLAASDPVHSSRFSVSVEDFLKIPGAPISYWLSDAFRNIFSGNQSVAEVATTRLGMTTANNELFTRSWWEVSRSRFAPHRRTSNDLRRGIERWVPYNKGGRFRKWYGNMETVLDWADDGHAIRNYGAESGIIRSTVPNTSYYFRECATWSKVSGNLAMRFRPQGSIFDVAGACAFTETGENLDKVLAVANSRIAKLAVEALSPSVNFEGGQISDLPIPRDFPARILEDGMVARLVGIAKRDWDQYEVSWAFEQSPLLNSSVSVAESYSRLRVEFQSMVDETRHIESEINSSLVGAFGLIDEVNPLVSEDEVTLNASLSYRYGAGKDPDTVEAVLRRDTVAELLSYSVGCMFGRYSLDEPGLILADQGATLHDYLAKVPSPTFTPDPDNVIPIVDGDWFEDDIVERFRQFLRAAFGEQHFEENLRFVTESLGVKHLRDYFITRAGRSKFYDDHVQRYKKRPIYWLFSSRKGSFNALIYMHRYTPSTVSTVLNENLREFQTKLKASLEHAERSDNAKEADRLRKVLLELDEYEHDVLYPLASQQIAIDLDDGVKVNYPKFGAALKKVSGLEAKE